MSRLTQRAYIALMMMLPHVVESQQSVSEASAGVLRGTVVSRESGLPLTAAIVSISSLGLQQFSSRQGTFYFQHVPPGTYRINVRQLGYTPAEASTTVGAAGNDPVEIRMARLATNLAPVQVVADQECVAPGRPVRSDDAALADVFEQFEQSAVRLHLFSAQYPFAISTERTNILERASGIDSIAGTDTTELESDSLARYKPGNVLTGVRRPGRGKSFYLRVPTLLEFGDAVFQKNHCFVLRGVETINSTKQIRIDFKAASKIKSPDVEGSVYLDSATFRMLRTEVRVTKIPGEADNMTGVEASTTFSDLTEGMPVISGIRAVTYFKPVKKDTAQFLRSVRQQLPVVIRFLKQRPDTTPPQ